MHAMSECENFTDGAAEKWVCKHTRVQKPTNYRIVLEQDLGVRISL